MKKQLLSAFIKKTEEKTADNIHFLFEIIKKCDSISCIKQKIDEFYKLLEKVISKYTYLFRKEYIEIFKDAIRSKYIQDT